MFWKPQECLNEIMIEKSTLPDAVRFRRRHFPLGCCSVTKKVEKK